MTIAEAQAQLVEMGVVFSDATDAASGRFLLNEAGELVDVDSVACSVLGQVSEALIGKSLAQWDRSFPQPFALGLWQSRPNTVRLQYGCLSIPNDAEQSVRYQVYSVEAEARSLLLLLAKPISDHERVEAALEQSQRQLQTIIDTEPECVKLVSRDGALMKMNPAGLAMVEADAPEQVIGMTISSLVHPDDREAFEGVNRRAFDGESGVAEFRLTGLKGSFRWLETHVTPLRDNNQEIIAALAITREVSDRKRADEILFKLLEGTAGTTGEQFFNGLTKALAEALNVAVAFIGETIFPEEDDLDSGRVVSISCCVDGKIADPIEYALANTPCRHVHEGGMCHFESGVAQQFPKDEMLVELGAEGYLGIPLKSESDDVIGILAVLDREPLPNCERTKTIFRIFAARAGAELNRSRIRRHEEELERQLQQVQRMESIGTLAGGIAHDFNNIVCAILANAELAMLDLDQQHAAFESVEGIVKSTKRASSLISQIMTFSRNKTPVRSAVTLDGTVEEAVKMMRSVIPATVELDCRIDSDQPHVFADADQMHQVVVNLCTNAWHAIGGQPGKISVALTRLDPGHESVVPTERLRDRPHVLLEVTDDGHGMDDEIRRRIFDPFFTTKDAGQGTGLGLSVVHGIVELHDGVIEVDSRTGFGSTFAVALPVVSDQAEQDTGTSHEAIEGDGRHVLCIDDEQAIVDVAQRLLERVGFETTGITNPQEALRRFESDPSRFDLVLVDYFMPKMTGLDVIRRIRSIRGDTPIILISGNIDESIRRAALADGVQGLLDKPFTSEELGTALLQALKEG